MASHSENLGTDSDFSEQIRHIDVSGSGGGTVLIRGGNFVLDNSTIFRQCHGFWSLSQTEWNPLEAGSTFKVSQNAIIQNGGVLRNKYLWVTVTSPWCHPTVECKIQADQHSYKKV